MNDYNTEKALRIAVVGAGPRGILIAGSVIKRVVQSAVSTRVELLLIDPKDVGTGCHDPDLPDYILMNTPAGQLTMFEEGCDVFSSDQTSGYGLNLAEWAARYGYLPPSPGGGASAPVFEKQYLPRKYLPRYMRYAFDCYLKMVPDNLKIEHLRANVSCVRQEADEFRLEMAEGSVAADHIFIATGHAPADTSAGPADDRASTGRFLTDPYQVDRMEAIASHHRVGIEGLGLTMFDVLAVLTEGRGGWFERKDDYLIYRSSGREPEILLFSRRCLPPLSRPKVSDPLVENWSPRFFTRQAVQALRCQSGKYQLDFEQDILPILVRELAFFHQMRERVIPGDASHFKVSHDVAQAITRALVGFETWEFASLSNFRCRFWEALRADIASASLGRAANVQGAFDIFKTLRPGLAEAVEFNGLTPQSHRWYTEFLSPAINRLSYGPPVVRNQKLLALHEAGIVEVAGPGTTTFTTAAVGGEVALVTGLGAYEIETSLLARVDNENVNWVIKAHLPSYNAHADPRPLAKSLLASGLASAATNGVYHVGGFKIDRFNRSISAGGETIEGLWIHGHPVEGTKFYGHAIPRVTLTERTFREVHQSVDLIFRKYEDEAANSRTDKE